MTNIKEKQKNLTEELNYLKAEYKNATYVFQNVQTWDALVRAGTYRDRLRTKIENMAPKTI